MNKNEIDNYDYYFDVSSSNATVIELESLITSVVTGLFAFIISMSELVEYINLKKKEKVLSDIEL